MLQLLVHTPLELHGGTTVDMPSNPSEHNLLRSGDVVIQPRGRICYRGVDRIACPPPYLPNTTKDCIQGFYQKIHGTGHNLMITGSILE